MGLVSVTTPPGNSQIEVTLIGPGFGESVLVHIGNNSWIIVDSCIDNKTGKPAAISYLEEIGVDPSTSVKLIVATHWHDDHIRGLHQVVKACPDAQFCCSMAFTTDEFRAFICAINSNNNIVSGSGARELYGIALTKEEERGSITRAVANKLLKRFSTNDIGQDCEVWSLSPSDDEISNSLAGLADQFPEITKPKKRIASTSPNNASVVLWIKVGDVSILLGADMENASGNRGWSAIVQSQEKPQGQASVFKIPHHGSQNGHHDDVWQAMLSQTPYAIVSPYNKTPLPREADRDRICGLTQNAYVTSNLKPKANSKRSALIEKTIKEAGVKITSSEPATGIVQLRHKANDDWDVTLVNRARHLSAVYS